MKTVDILEHFPNNQNIQSEVCRYGNDSVHEGLEYVDSHFCAFSMFVQTDFLVAKLYKRLYLSVSPLLAGCLPCLIVKYYGNYRVAWKMLS